MPARFVDVIVEAHGDLPDGCAVQFRVLGEPRPVNAVRYRPPGIGAAGVFQVQGRARGGAAVPAQATPVHVTGGPARVLVSGGAWGLRLTPAAGATCAEPYLLIDDSDVTT